MIVVLHTPKEEKTCEGCENSAKYYFPAFNYYLCEDCLETDNGIYLQIYDILLTHIVHEGVREDILALINRLR